MKTRNNLGRFESCEKITKHCLTCGREYNVIPYLNKSKFCSHGCYSKSLIKEKPQKPEHTRITSPKMLKICPNCNKGFYVTQRNQKRVYCDVKCYGEYHKGERHHAYRNGTSVKRFNYSEWDKIRKAVYERDNWTCKICGVKCHGKIMIQCHHVVPYRITQDNSMENLVTLCASCHTREENKYYKSLNKQLEINFTREV